MVFHSVSKFGVKGPLGSIFRSVRSLHLILEESWRPTCMWQAPVSNDYTDKGHPFGSFIQHCSFICIFKSVSLRFAPCMSCLPNFPVRLMEFVVYVFADDHIWSHLPHVFLIKSVFVSLLLFSVYILRLFWRFPFPSTISASQRLLAMGLVPLVCLSMVTPQAGGVFNNISLYSCSVRFIKPFSMCRWSFAWCCESGWVRFFILLRSQSWGSRVLRDSQNSGTLKVHEDLLII